MMNRRHLITGVLALPALLGRASSRSLVGVPDTSAPHGAVRLAPSGALISSSDGQVFENLDIRAEGENGLTIRHQRVTVRNCRVRHAGAHGVHAEDAGGLVLQNLEIDHVGAPLSGVGPSPDCNNLNLTDCPEVRIDRVKASRGSSNVYIRRSNGAYLSFLELHDARGPLPRGQNVQLHGSPDSRLEDFSAENGSSSWTEDNVSVFRSDRCVVRRGLVSYNNSPSGDGVMVEGSFDCLVEDVDAVQQGNGAFAAVPQGEAGCGGCSFVRCRTTESYNAPRDGRDAPSSRGLSIYVRISNGARKHTVVDCEYFSVANPRNLIWDLRAVNPGWSFKHRPFLPRQPVRLAFGWN